MKPVYPPAVILDAGPAVHQQAGLARYTAQLAAALARLAPDELTLGLFYNAHSGHSLPPSLRAIPARSITLGQYAWRIGALASQLLHSRFLERRIVTADDATRRPIYHATEHLLPYLTCPTLLTVHDLIFERYPTHHTRANRLFLRVAMPRFVAAARHIIAVSQQTRRDLIELYATPSAKISVVYEGIDARFAPAPTDDVARVRKRYSPDRPYLLMVGTLEPRKNHATALAALARLKATGVDHRLVVVGGSGWLFDSIQPLVERLGLTGDVHFAGYIPDDDLPPLYSGAACVLQPSLYEGFGFPVLEAMACGAPVVCSNASSLPELAADAGLLVPPTDDEALAAAIQRVLNEAGLAPALRAAGLARASQFRWQRCAAKTVEVYQELVR